MRKLLMLIGALIMCNAYGDDQYTAFLSDGSAYGLTTCTSSQSIPLPTTVPEKANHRFMGWEDNGTLYDFLGTDGTTSSGSGASWSAIFPWGAVLGTSRCSATLGTVCTDDDTGATCTTSSSPTSTSAVYAACWCKATTISTTNGSVSVQSATQWAYYTGGRTQWVCSDNCAAACGSGFRTSVAIRRAIFKVAGQ